jgi:hypothetical protein
MISLLLRTKQTVAMIKIEAGTLANRCWETLAGETEIGAVTLVGALWSEWEPKPAEDQAQKAMEKIQLW